MVLFSNTKIQSNLTDCVNKRGELSFSDKGFLRIKVKKKIEMKMTSKTGVKQVSYAEVSIS